MNGTGRDLQNLSFVGSETSIVTGSIFMAGKGIESTAFVMTGAATNCPRMSRPKRPYSLEDSTTVIVAVVSTSSDFMQQSTKSPSGFILCPSYAEKNRFDTMSGGLPISRHIRADIIVAAAPVSTSMMHRCPLRRTVSRESAECVGIVSMCRCLCYHFYALSGTSTKGTCMLGLMHRMMCHSLT